MVGFCSWTKMEGDCATSHLDALGKSTSASRATTRSRRSRLLTAPVNGTGLGATVISQPDPETFD